MAEFELRLWKQLSSRFPRGTSFLGLTSIHWREAWKYGQRAYRYCQHDAGHAIGAISIAAAGLGWQTRILDDLGRDELALLLGTFPDHDAEPEEPDVLLACGPFEETSEIGLPEEQVRGFESLKWHGSPNQLSPSHVGVWMKLQKLLRNHVVRVSMSGFKVRRSSGLWKFPQFLFAR